MYAVKNWAAFQHYGKRNPPWIKLHKHFLDDFDFHSLPLASRALAPMMWLLASEHENPKAGFIEGDAKKIAFRLHMTLQDFESAIKPLIDKGFILNASKPLATRKQTSRPETETETENRDRDTINVFSNRKENRYARQKETGSSEGKRIAEKILRGESLGTI